MSYILVCSDLHQAVGPIEDAKLALSLARIMSERSKCDFAPVELVAVPPELGASLTKITDTTTKQAYEHKGYL